MARVGSNLGRTVRPIIQNKIYIISLKFVLKPLFLVDLFR